MSCSSARRPWSGISLRSTRSSAFARVPSWPRNCRTARGVNPENPPGSTRRSSPRRRTSRQESAPSTSGANAHLVGAQTAVWPQIRGVREPEPSLCTPRGGTPNRSPPLAQPESAPLRAGCAAGPARRESRVGEAPPSSPSAPYAAQAERTKMPAEHQSSSRARARVRATDIRAEPRESHGVQQAPPVVSLAWGRHPHRPPRLDTPLKPSGRRCLPNTRVPRARVRACARRILEPSRANPNG